MSEGRVVGDAAEREGRDEMEGGMVSSSEDGDEDEIGRSSAPRWRRCSGEAGKVAI